MSGGYGGQLNSGEAFKQSALGKSSAIAGQSMNQGAGFAPTLPQYESGGDSGTTYATLSEGRLNIGGKAATAQELGINSDAATAHRQIDALPDIREVMQKQQTVAKATADIFSAVRTFSGNMAADALKEQQQAQEQLQTALQSNDQAAIDTAAVRLDLASRAAKDWEMGGSKSRALNVVSTLATGLLGGQSDLQAAANTLAPYAAETVGKTFGQSGSHPNEAAQLLSHAVIGGLLAYANGGSFGTGAVAGAGAEAAAKAITAGLYGQEAADNPNNLTEDQKENIRSLSSAVGAFVGSIGGDSALSAQINAAVGKNAVENNYLLQQDWDKYRDTIKSCSQNQNIAACYRTAQQKLYAISKNRNEKLKAACAENGNITLCSKYVKEADLSREITKKELNSYGNNNPAKPIPAFVNYYNTPWANNPSIHYWATTINLPITDKLNYGLSLAVNRVTGEIFLGASASPNIKENNNINFLGIPSVTATAGNINNLSSIEKARLWETITNTLQGQSTTISGCGYFACVGSSKTPSGKISFEFGITTTKSPSGSIGKANMVKIGKFITD
ncbi:VENN motif pre-toxin domain-containing protein [Neisseria arctica]|uniref:VENN motif pre-toxin domain-containing protein n=1 Tax=Neisseria arctica TaxID=1470200 RepID=UPI001FD59555|nr:VENN motif pre-toxin domain-containing protein [Neisseria arctica]UOO87156.1 VENN motif pre-toxin domain-containing protein [Neisseria arctica]